MLVEIKSRIQKADPGMKGMEKKMVNKIIMVHAL